MADDATGGPVPGLPDAPALEGASFPPLVKLLATALVLALLVSGARVAGTLARANINLPDRLMLLAGVVIVLVCYVAMLRSRTGISATHVHQRGLWTKRVALADITHAKLIHFPRLAWLVSPRLMVKAKGRGVLTFFTSDPAVLARMRAIGLGSLPSPHG